ncbi:hypothetical protein [Fischerella sp. PCC 9605]|nr:hypothetical protein [Fischerella sp. PCC 9605]
MPARVLPCCESAAPFHSPTAHERLWVVKRDVVSLTTTTSTDRR